ncbi:MAG TPA: HAD hydrolase family protein [Alphaproteobacteria bacterium]|nr:HAD hydrolase family protein [Alphaproteobacteria bacterium]
MVALNRLKRSGRKLLMVTGRELSDLKRVFSRLDLFDRVIAENGALLYQPDSDESVPFGDPPPPEFIERLKRAAIPLSIGRSIVATVESHETTVLDVICDLGLELQIIFNKGAVMVLPAGVNKAIGLASGLNELGLSPHNVAGIGDAENDHAFLGLCGASAAVANALPSIKKLPKAIRCPSDLVLFYWRPPARAMTDPLSSPRVAAEEFRRAVGDSSAPPQFGDELPEGMGLLWRVRDGVSRALRLIAPREPRRDP